MPERQAGRSAPSLSVYGLITIAQEDRIRLVDAAGRGYLFILDKGCRWSLARLRSLAHEQRQVLVHYRGPVDQGAVALSLRPMPRRSAN